MRNQTLPLVAILVEEEERQPGKGENALNTCVIYVGIGCYVMASQWQKACMACLLPLRFFLLYSFELLIIQPFLFGRKMCCCYGSMRLGRMSPGNEFVHLKLLFSLAYVCLRGVCARLSEDAVAMTKFLWKLKINTGLFNKMGKACAPFAATVLL